MGRCHGRFAVAIETQEGEVEVVARKIEVVWIAAEEGRLGFRREDKSHVIELVVDVELVETTLVERHHFAGSDRVLTRAGHLFDARENGVSGRDKSLALTPADGRIDLGGDVGDRAEHVSLHVRAAALFTTREAVLHEVVSRIRQIVGTVHHAVVVGERQPFAGDHRRRTAHR